MVPSLSPQSVPNLIHPAVTTTLQRYPSLLRGVSEACGYALSPRDTTIILITNVKTSIVHTWNSVFDYTVSRPMNIPDVWFRYFLLLVLGLMRAVSFSVAIVSYSFMATSILGQFFLIAAAAVTGATFTVAAKQSKLFVHGAGRHTDCKHALFLILTGHKLKLQTFCAGPLEKSAGQGI